MEGDVRRPLELSYKDLGGMRQVPLEATLECAGNGRVFFKVPNPKEFRWGLGAVSTARWSGVPLSDILDQAGASSGASDVVAEGMDEGIPAGRKEKVSYSRSLPIGKARDGAVVALRMNGRRLPAEHGFPCRLLVPGWYGMASVKWLKRIVVFSGGLPELYYNTTKYVYIGRGGGEGVEPVREMLVKSLVTSPLEGQTLRAGRPALVQGKAWSGSAAVSKVEVNVGNGWEEAMLVKGSGRYSWCTWSKRWTPGKSGEFAISARATDAAGNEQPAMPVDNVLQYGVNPIHTVRIRVV